MTAACPHERTRDPRAVALGVVALAAFVQTACTTVVTPPDPALLREPVSVYLIDYHRHSSLMLPRCEASGGGLREYAFGEWGWFAENRTGGFRAVGVLFLPNQGALGRADHPMPSGPDELRATNGFEAVHEIRVERERAMELLARLDLRYAARLDTQIANPAVGLDLVKDDERYSLANHCNHVTARWLRELGIDVGHVSAIADFRIRKPPCP